MAFNNGFGIIGGDLRQVYLAQSIAADGYPVYTHALERAPKTELLPRLALWDILERCSCFVFPLPATKNGRTLNAPFSETDLVLDDNFASRFSGKYVYGGMLSGLLDTSELWHNAKCHDYYAGEALMVGNASLTAEGALAEAIVNYPGAICGCACLVTGFGRIGKALCPLLRTMGAQVDCAARKNEDLMMIKTMGCTPVKYGDSFPIYDIIFNTVPVTVLGASELSRQSRDTLIIELASAPGGVDLEVVHRLGLRIINAQSIPGRYSPKTSGEYIKEAIYNLMEE